MDRTKFWKAVWNVAKNTVCINAIAFLIGGPLHLWLGCPIKPDEIPTFWRFVLDIIVFTIAQEFAFYYSHRYGWFVLTSTCIYTCMYPKILLRYIIYCKILLISTYVIGHSGYCITPICTNGYTSSIMNGLHPLVSYVSMLILLNISRQTYLWSVSFV